MAKTPKTPKTPKAPKAQVAGRLVVLAVLGVLGAAAMTMHQQLFMLCVRNAPPAPALPYDAEIEYIEGTGTQFIDTGITSSDTMTCQARVGVVSGYPDVFVGQCVDDSNDWRFFYPAGSCVDMKSSRLYQNVKMTAGNLYDVEFGNFYIKVGGTTNSGTAVTGISQHNILIMAKKNSNGTYCYNVRCGAVKLTDNGVTVRDMIAVRKDGVGYMYDRVSGTLLGNGGTGAFVIGPDK